MPLCLVAPVIVPEQQKKGRQLGPKLDTSVQVEVAPQKPPPDTPQTVLPPKHLSLRELTKAAGKASASPSVGAEKEPISAQDREEVQKEDAAAALMRTLARRRIPRAPAGDEAAGQAPRDEVAEVLECVKSERNRCEVCVWQCNWGRAVRVVFLSLF